MGCGKLERYAGRVGYGGGYWNDGRSASEVILNSAKGKAFFKDIQKEAKRCEQVPIETTYGNRIKGVYLPHPEHEHFVELAEKEPFNDAVDAALNRKFSIGLVSNWASENYGATITHYALYSVLHDTLGKDVLMIERPGSAPWPPKNPPSQFMELPYPKYAMQPYTQDKAGMYRLNGHCDTFVLGSDQNWNNNLYNGFGEFADLRWVNSDHRKIAYAASFGHDFIIGSDDDRRKLAFWLQKFDAVSVREKSAVGLLRDKFGVDGTWVLDPVFLCDKEKYKTLAMRGGSREREKENYLFSYMLDIDEGKASLLKRAAADRAVNLTVVTDAGNDNVMAKETWSIPLFAGVNEEEWLAYFINAKCVITDSFHGMCFAVIFRKPFIAIVNEGRGATRFYSIAEMLELEAHLVENVEDAERKLALLSPKAVDWEKVERLLNAERARSFAWLKNALSLPINRQRTPYDMLAPSVEAHNEHIHYADNVLCIDVLPSQAASGKRTRLAIVDQGLLFQIWDRNSNLEQNLSISELSARLAELSARVEEGDRKIAGLSARLAERDDKIAELSVWLSVNSKTIDSMAAYLARVRGSHPYRIMRKAYSVLKKIKKLFCRR